MRTITQTRNSRFSLFTTITLLALLCTTAFAQQKGTLKDTRDGKTYKTVKMGKQTWMAENLNYNLEGSKCSDNKPANCTKYGKLYNWETAMLACPKGWHLPTTDELDTLINFAGGKEIAGKNLKAKSGWNKNSEGKSGNGTDKFGFSALPGSGRGSEWWSATKKKYDNAYYWYIYDEDNTDYSVHRDPVYNPAGPGPGPDPDEDRRRSVRCVQGEPSAEAKEIIANIEAWNKAEAERAEANKKAAAERAKAEAEAAAERAKAEAEAAKAEAEAKKKAEAEAKAKLDAIRKTNGGKFTDTRDKKTYLTIKIGEQTWMAENLNYADKDSKCYDNKEDNCKKYGRLYNWETATKACPKGWHLPSDAEWSKPFAGGGTKLKTTNGWDDDLGKSSNGTDDYGFSALPGGYGDNYDNTYSYKRIGKSGEWWSSIEESKSEAHTWEISLRESRYSRRGKSYLFSVRCLQGEAPAPKPASQPQPSQKPANQPASQPNQNPNENCSITFPKKACVAMPTGTCKMAGGKVVDKCP